jgi:hypothetical protein
MRPGRVAPAPQQAASFVADDGGLAGVLFLLAGHKRPPAGSVGFRSADLDLGAVDAQFDAFGGSVGEHVGQGPQAQAGCAWYSEPAGGQQRADLTDRPGDRGPVDSVEQAQGGVWELETQHDQGGDDPVGERQVVVGASAFGPLSVAASAFP